MTPLAIKRLPLVSSILVVAASIASTFAQQPPLDEVRLFQTNRHSFTVGGDFIRYLTADDELSAENLQVIHGLRDNLPRLSLREQSMQLQVWLSVREQLTPDSLTNVFLSQLFGVIIADTTNALLIEVERTARGPDGKVRTLHTQPLREIALLVDLAVKNHRISEQLRTPATDLFGTTEDPVEVFKAIANQAHSDAAKSYAARWGPIVLSLERARGSSAAPNVLQSLVSNASKSWASVRQSPTASSSKCWFAAVDLYIFASTYTANVLLTQLGGNAVPVSDPVWANNRKEEQTITELQTIAKEVDEGHARNCLILR